MVGFPKITVITVCMNAADALERTLKNISQQDYSNMEVIVVDGASTDSTPDVMREMSGLISRSVSEKDKGIYDAVNKARVFPGATAVPMSFTVMSSRRAVTTTAMSSMRRIRTMPTGCFSVIRVRLSEESACVSFLLISDIRCRPTSNCSSCYGSAERNSANLIFR